MTKEVGLLVLQSSSLRRDFASVFFFATWFNNSFFFFATPDLTIHYSSLQHQMTTMTRTKT